MNNLELAKLIKDAVKADKRQAKDIAKEAGIHPVTLSNYMSGENVPQGDILLRLAKVLKLDITGLLNISQKATEPTETPLQGQIVHDHAAMPLDQDPAYWRGKYEAQKEIVDQLLSAKKDKPDTPPASKPTTPDPKPPSAPPSGTVKKNQEKGSNKE